MASGWVPSYRVTRTEKVTAWQSSKRGGGELVPGPGELGEKAKVQEPRSQDGCWPGWLEVSCWKSVAEVSCRSSTRRSLAKPWHWSITYMFSCLPLPPTGATPKTSLYNYNKSTHTHTHTHSESGEEMYSPPKKRR